MKRLCAIVAVATLCVFGMSAAAFAGASATWIGPADGSHYCVGTAVAITGSAAGTGSSGGSGLDLALVLDSSGSMSSNATSGGVTKTRSQWMKDAANALVAVLPTATTSVAVIEFDSDSNTVKVLTQLTSDNSAITAAINGVDASGNTAIHAGIATAQTELTSGRHIAGRAQMMVVISDGESSSSSADDASDTAGAAGIAIHSVGIPGHTVYVMQVIVNGNDDAYGNTDDWGVYTNANDLSTLESLLTGTGGNIVGLDHVDVTLNGTGLAQGTDFAVDGLGNVTLDVTLGLGANTLVMTAYATDQTTATDTLILYGDQVPEPGTMILMGVCLLGTALFTRRRRRG